MIGNTEVKEYPTHMDFCKALVRERPDVVDEFIGKLRGIPLDGSYNKALDALCLEFGGKIAPARKVERHCCCGSRSVGTQIYS